ncbi:MAG TPA: type II secretion system protein N [Oligoflexia bacterium]|nr:type II secretion system protein N [Oligoflexia bacterium]
MNFPNSKSGLIGSFDKSKVEILSRFIWLLGKLAIFFAVGFAVSARSGLNEYNSLIGTNIPLTNKEEKKSIFDPASSQDRLKQITERNLFKVGIKSLPPGDKSIPTAKTKLDFRLVGTSVSSSKPSFAIIENSQKKQDVFEINEKVFNKAGLKEIHPDKVILDLNGKLEILELEGGTPGSSGPGSSIQSTGTEFIVPEQELTDALNNLPVLLSQARAVPYFRNGQSIGMRLYAIKAGSLYEKLGLKNSDVIKTVNNTQVSDPTKALKLFEDLKSERSIGVTVEREGQDVDLRYQIR